MKIAFLNLGCKVNKYETDLLIENSKLAGYFIVDFEDTADIYVINSCSVTNMSDRKTRQMISKARSKNNESIVAVMGCSVEGKKESLEEFKADILIGNKDKLNLINILTEYLKERKGKNKTILLTDISKEKRYYQDKKLLTGQDVRQSIKIEDGCNNFCSYCIIPYLRGRVRSRKKEDILEEINTLVVNKKVKEIIISGIEITSYGTDFKNEYNLIDLINEISSIKEVLQIRLTSIEPRFLTKENIIRLSKIKKLCPHFHISMQSGNTETLKRMNRKYSKEHLIQICENIRRYFSNPYIAADIIVGFPKETEEEFLDTLDTINKTKPANIHVFKYSKRNYTVASKIKEQVSGETKIKRSKIIREYSKYAKLKYLTKELNKTKKVLFESYENGYLEGVTTNYIKVKVKGDESLCGTIQNVDLISLEKETLQGKIKK